MIQAEPLKSVYHLYGKHPFLINQKINHLKKCLAAKNQIEYVKLDGDSAKATEILAAANSFSLIAEKKLVVVRRADMLSGVDCETLAEYIENPNDKTCLVLTSTKLLVHKRLINALKKSGLITECKLPKGGYLVWIKEQFSKRNKFVSTEVARYLWQCVGNDLERLSQEIDKICLGVNATKISKITEVEEIVSKSPEASIFILTDYLAGRSRQNCFLVLDYLLKTSGVDPTSIITFIARQFRLLLKVKYLTEQGLNRRQIAEKLAQNDKKLLDFVIEKLQKQSTRFSYTELRQIIYQVFLADLALKSGQKESASAVEDLVLEIIKEK
jgi:DNA polymerase-3 subunit delta